MAWSQIFRLTQGQEANLAPPSSRLRSFGRKFTVLKYSRHCWGFGRSPVNRRSGHCVPFHPLVTLLSSELITSLQESHGQRKRILNLLVFSSCLAVMSARATTKSPPSHTPRYNPKQNRWGKVCSMSTKRLGVAVAVLGGYLYAIGGSDGQTPWNLVERYDPKENRWSDVASMSTRRKHLGCAVYRVGVFNGCVACSVGVFDGCVAF